MRQLLIVSAVVALGASAMAQSHYVGGHRNKDGTYTPPHYTKPESHAHQHRERRFYPTHTDKNGKIIQAHWQTVWVND